MLYRTSCVYSSRPISVLKKNTRHGKLHFESQALEFLCELLSLNFKKSGNRITTNWKFKAAVDEAVDILQKEGAHRPEPLAQGRRGAPARGPRIPDFATDVDVAAEEAVLALLRE